MALTPSSMPQLGTRAPLFNLADQQGYHWSLADFSDRKALLVMFICNHCPFVIHLKPAIAQFARDYANDSLGIIAINANDTRQYPADAPHFMAQESERYRYIFPYVFDATQSVAKSFQAACTPDFFLYDDKRELVYRGQFDDSRPGNDKPVSGADLRQAVEAVLHDLPPLDNQHPSVGCNIKWREETAV